MIAILIETGYKFEYLIVEEDDYGLNTQSELRNEKSLFGLKETLFKI